MDTDEIGKIVRLMKRTLRIPGPPRSRRTDPSRRMRWVVRHAHEYLRRPRIRRTTKRRIHEIIAATRPRPEFVDLIPTEPVYLPLGNLPFSPLQQRKANLAVIHARRTEGEGKIRHKRVRTEWFNVIRSIDDIRQALTELHEDSPKQYKIKVRFSVLLYRPADVEAGQSPGDWKIDTANANRHHLNLMVDGVGVERPAEVRNLTDFRNEVLDLITPESLFSKIKYPNSATKIAGVYGMWVFIAKTGLAIGAADRLPQWMKTSLRKCLVLLDDIPDNLCLVACVYLGLHPHLRRKNRITAAVRKMACRYADAMGWDKTREFPGINIFDDEAVGRLEDMFGVRLAMYTRNQDGNVESIRPCTKVVDDKKPKLPLVNVNIWENHASYIKNMNLYQKAYFCPKCRHCFRRANDLSVHSEACEHIPGGPPLCERKFPKNSTPFTPRRGKLYRLLRRWLPEKYSYDPNVCVVDWESRLMPIEEKDAGSERRRRRRLRFTKRHVPLSVSFASNVSKQARIPVHLCAENYASPSEMNVALILALNELRNDALNNYWFPLIDRLYTKRDRQSVSRPYESVVEGIKRMLSNQYHLPIVGYNTSGYDIPLNQKHGLLSYLASEKGRVVRTWDQDKKGEWIESKKPQKGLDWLCRGDGGKFRCMTTAGGLRWLDMGDYVPPNTRLVDFCESWNGKDSLQKGFFPYDFVSSLRDLNTPITELVQSDFDDSLNRTRCTQKVFEEHIAKCVELGLETVRDLLRWYNNLDVGPFLQASEKVMRYHRRQGVDMFHDGISLSGISLIKMFRKRNRHPLKPPDGDAFQVSDQKLKKRISSHRQADRACKRPVDRDYVTPENLRRKLTHHKYRCVYCWTKLGADEWEIERIDNRLAATNENTTIACRSCNGSRRDRCSYHWFLSLKSEERYAAYYPSIWMIDEENSEIYDALHTTCAGPSLIFHRFHQVGVTHIQKVRTSWSAGECKWVKSRRGSLVRTILGLDANALYPFCYGKYDMPCGRMSYVEQLNMTPAEVTEAILTDDLWGFLEVDLKVPGRLYDYFSEMAPIFKNTTIHPEQIPENMREHFPKPGGKLVASMFANRRWTFQPYLKWMLEHGVEIKAVRGYIQAEERGKPFEKFVDEMADARRQGDVDPTKKMFASEFKNAANAAAGKCNMDKSRHCTTRITTDAALAYKHVNDPYFRGGMDIDGHDDDTITYISEMGKRSVFQVLPVHVSAALLDVAKLCVLQFHYDFIDRFVDRQNYQLLKMDTDSTYYAFGFHDDGVHRTEGLDTWKRIVRPELWDEFLACQDEHLVQYDCDPKKGGTCTPEEHKRHDKRTPGLFKVEFEASAFVGLRPKCDFCCGLDDGSKIACKGAQNKRNQHILTFENYKKALFNRVRISGQNRGFREIDGEIYTYSQDKNVLSAAYDKRGVMDDLVTCYTLLDV